VGVEQPATLEKKGQKKGPGWLLSRDVEMELDPQAIAQKFWKQEVSGFSNEEFFGSMRREVQDIILSKAKKKRFYREGPYLLAMHSEEESDGSTIDEGFQVCEVRANPLEKEEIPSVKCMDITASRDEKLAPKQAEETQESYWARGCAECEIEMEGVRGSIHALIDSGSEVNVMSKKTYDAGQWAIDRDIQWRINGVTEAHTTLWGACPNVKIKIGNVLEPINIFVHDTLPYPVILGQPFITQLRMETKVLDDGTHIAKIRSRNGLRVVQFPTVRPGNGRNKLELRAKGCQHMEDF
jgi:hypothetical protein